MNVQTKTRLQNLGGLLLLLCSAPLFSAPIFTPESQPTGSIARPALSSTDPSSGNENFYQSNYYKDTWAGDVLAKKINTPGFVQTTGPWDSNDPTTTTAAPLLDSLSYPTNSRKIVTHNGSTGIAFGWGNLSTSQQASIGDATMGPKIVDFVRGDRSNEEPNGVSYHARQYVLGDILHSSLYYWKHNSTTKRLYVGSNDGMLHVFNADTGSEVFAYIPSMVIPNLKLLVNKPYVHTHFVDGPISIADVDFSGTNKTLLVGGLGAGGKGLYALDVTDASPTDETAAASKIKWEITSSTSGFADLGYTYGTPRISRLNDGTPVAIVGNGYMNGGSGHAVLYVINVDTGALISAIDTGSGTSASPSGLSTPTLLDTNGDNKADYAYAGDIDGKLWKFNLTTNTATLLYTTSPAQAITVAPAVSTHPNGGWMVVFATGQILTSGDKIDTAVHYVYGIWDGAPAANNQLLTQTLTQGIYVDSTIRTITANPPDWTAGTGHHFGWQVALPAGERVTGEMPYESEGLYFFISTNPTIINSTLPNGANWLNNIVFLTGGSTPVPIFDFNKDGLFNSADLADSCTPAGTTYCVPVSKYLGGGVFSQPVSLGNSSFSTFVWAYHPDEFTESGVVVEPTDPGVSGGHFDFDIYYYGTPVVITTNTPTTLSETKNNICAKTSDVQNQYNKVSTSFCTTNKGFSSGYGFLTAYTQGSQNSSCKGDKYYQTITCNTYTVTTSSTSNYANKKHYHEYDDVFDVTGVNMLNASEPLFNLSNAIIDTSTSFKILVMNQYLSPAAKLSVGGVTYESVKTYKNLASETNPSTLLGNLPIYTRADIGTLIYNLPLDAFKSKDWWGGEDGSVRAGLIPTQTGCVNKVNIDGSMLNTGGKGLPGPNGERFNGALTIQLIKSTTPASALELNKADGNSGDGIGDVRYGWRVKQSEFSNYVLAEYTSFWHHPNGLCYGQSGWVADPPEDFVSDATAKTPAAGSADPKDGVFSAGLAIVSTETTVSGNTTTTVTTYSDGSTYTKEETVNSDGSTTIIQTFRDNTTTVTTINNASIGTAGYGRAPNINLCPLPPCGGGGATVTGKRISWRQLR